MQQSTRIAPSILSAAFARLGEEVLVMDDVDMILVMSVNPGFGGQKFIPSQLDKIRELRQRIDATGRVIDLEVDGGVSPANAAEIIAAGADVLVAGSASFKGGPDCYADNIRQIRSAD